MHRRPRKACANAKESSVLSTTGSPDAPDVVVTKNVPHALRPLHWPHDPRVPNDHEKAVPRGIAKNAVGNRITKLEKLIPGCKLRLLSTLASCLLDQLPTRTAANGPKMKKTIP